MQILGGGPIQQPVAVFAYDAENESLKLAILKIGHNALDLGKHILAREAGGGHIVLDPRVILRQHLAYALHAELGGVVKRHIAAAHLDKIKFGKGG